MNSICDLGDGVQRWFRGMPRPQHLFAPFKEDFYIYVIGCVLRYIRIEPKGPNRCRVLRTLKHGFDGVSVLEANPLREVYALAERSVNPRVYIYRIDRGRKDPYEPRIVAKLTGIQAMEIRAVRFNKKDLIVVLTGYPSFNLSIWKWPTEQELMLALCNEPSLHSDLLISPMNECHWVEYGRQHLTFYDLQSFTKNDVIRTQIYLPQRQLSYNSPDPLMGLDFAMNIVSACFTQLGDFFVLDDHFGLHVLNQEDKILNWLGSIGFSFTGSNIMKILPFGNSIAISHKDGWFQAYDMPNLSGKLEVTHSFKLTSNIVKYFQFPGNPESFFAITEKDGLIEGVQEGAVMIPFNIPDLMYSNILCATFIEPKSDYCALLTKKGRVCVVDSETGELIEEWRLAFKPACILSHPVLPFVFCGTNYGCVNILNIQNLKKPKLIGRIYMTKEPKSYISKMAFVSQGRYLISADTENDKIFLQYGYPFEEFEYLDYAKLPGEIRQLNVPGCGREDLRVQVIVYSKNKVEELCPTYVYNFALSNDRLILAASQSIENPIKAIALSPIKKYLYTYHVEKKQLALTPFCDDNTWTVLQEPDQYIQCNLNLDINKMIVQGDKLYTFGEDGYLMVFEAPVPQKKDAPIVAKVITVVQTHLFVDGGIVDGIVSLDGSQVITIGMDGTFNRLRILEKPQQVNWGHLGYEKPKLVQYQMASYAIDHEGTDVERVVSVSHSLRQGELPAPEFWVNYENTLMLKQFHPRSVKLEEEFLRMIDLMRTIMAFNQTREEKNQIDISEFNLDDEIEEVLMDKGTKYVQYCHILMMARNKLRKDRISQYRNMIWEPFEHKGLQFSGFKTTAIINNYPLLPFKKMFGNMIRQCQEERRLELRVESSEDEIIDWGNEFTLEILKAEVDYVEPESRQIYIKSIMSMDPNAKFDDYQSSDEGETDDEFLKAVFQELGITVPTDESLKEAEVQTKLAKEKLSRIMKRGKAAEKSSTAFGSHVPTVRREIKSVRAPSHSSRSRRQKKKRISRNESAVRKRLLNRRRLEQEDTEDDEDLYDSDGKKKRKAARVGFKTSDSGGNDDSQDDDFDDTTSYYSSSVAVSKKDILAKIKPTKSYISAHGLFGPKGTVSHVQTIMAPSTLNSSKKKKRKKNKSKEASDREKGKRVKKSKVNKYVVLSDEDPSDKDDEEFIKLKDLKLASIDEDQISPYKNVEQVFSGSITHELQEMHQCSSNFYRYHQFELHARHQFIRQLWLSMEEIYRLKVHFNKLFEQAKNLKAHTLKKMADRNERIREIYYYLKLDLDILDDKLDPREDPTLIFSVNKSEIPIEKYLTAEQRRLEELKRQEAIDRRNTVMAKFRRRALKVMMDNRLEVKREEILVRDIPKPAFMKEKDPMMYSLEEYIESLEYQEAFEELEKARVELIKELQTELYRLYRNNALDYNGMDMRVQELHQTRIHFHYNIVMEETKLERMLRQMRIVEDCQLEEDRVNNMLISLQDGMKSTQFLVSQLTARKNGCKDKITDLSEKQKELEKRFRKDLGDVGQFFEFFIRNYKKKPKINVKGIDKSELYENGVKALKSSNIRAFARENGDAAKAIVLCIMDIEDPMLMPVGCPRTYWDNFNKLRRERLACEFEMKALNLEMQHITEGLDECKEREEETAKAMAAILAILSHRTDMKNYYIYNTEFQFITGKGNVEINFWEPALHELSVMTLGKHIEQFNAHIFAASDLYIQDVRKSMLIHRDIREIEWRFMVVHLALSDANKLLHDVNNSKPRKELLKVLGQGVNLDTMYEDRMNLVQYLQATSIKFQKIYLAARRRLQNMYIRQTKRQEKVNMGLKDWLTDENKTTSLLKYAGIKTTPEQREHRYNERVNKFLVKGYLVRKMHVNYQTIDYLEGELGRYYQKSFPVL